MPTDFRPRGVLLLLAFLAGSATAAPPKNVILFIGDGMGSEQIKAAGYYFNGAEGAFSFEQMSNKAWMTTNLSGGGLTDSAASATAIATGFKVDSDVLSVALASGVDARNPVPSDGRPLQTLLEYFTSQGKRTGVVTTSFLTDATPGAFAAHANHRDQTVVIGNSILNDTRPNVLLGGGDPGLPVSSTTAAGYHVASNLDQLLAVDTLSVDRLAGFFGTGQFPFAYDAARGATNFYNTAPTLAQMTGTALDLLRHDSDGFFLMVENELTDAAGHLPVTNASKLDYAMHEIREMDRAVQKALQFAQTNPDTLVLVTADHETGSFVTTRNNGLGIVPTAYSGDTRHNATMTPVFAQGPSAGQVIGIIDNTELRGLITHPNASPAQGPIGNASFRQGVEGYASAIDGQINAETPDSTGQALAQLNVDTDGNYHSVLRFADLFGPDAIPADAMIVGAKLSIYTGNTSSSDGSARQMSIHRLLVPIDANTTYRNAGHVPDNGLSLNSPGSEDDDYVALAESIFPAPARGSIVTFDVTDSLAAWLNGYVSGNPVDFGWVIFNSGTDGWRPLTSDSTEPAVRPLLEVTYVLVPEPGSLVVIGCAAALLRRSRRC